jgi:YidC/Oxa1 family membrane protein insertase
LNFWNYLILDPLINVLVVISTYLGHNFGISIIVLTLLVNLALYPLTIKQIRASKALQDVQAKIADIQKKYAKDKQKAAEEQMRLMKEAGANPAGCLLPMLIQMPVWIALYQAIIQVLAVIPEDFLNLSSHLYKSWPTVWSSVPLQSQFLWLNLAAPDQWMVLPLLVGGTMWVQQKMSTPPTMDPKQQAQNQMTLWMMPILFAFMSLSFPSGLALYWVVSSIVRIILQYFITGWGGLVPPKSNKPKEVEGRVTRVTKPAPKRT